MQATATAALLACAAALLASGVAGAAPSPGGGIVFGAQLPAYPLPDNFQNARVFSIGLDGRGRREAKPDAGSTSSNDGAPIYFTRATAEGAELWVEQPDGTGARRLALLTGSGPATEIGSSPARSVLAVGAGRPLGVGGGRPGPHARLTPARRAARSH